jgi:hypothetical protein
MMSNTFNNSNNIYLWNMNIYDKEKGLWLKITRGPSGRLILEPLFEETLHPSTGDLVFEKGQLTIYKGLNADSEGLSLYSIFEVTKPTTTITNDTLHSSANNRKL